MSQEYSYQNNFKFEFFNETYQILDKSVVRSNLPGIISGTAEFITPIKNFLVPGESAELSDLSIEFVLDEAYSNWLMVYRWIIANKNFKEVNSDQIFTDISISVLSNKYRPIFSILFEDCFPISIDSLAYETRISDSSPHIFNVNFITNNIDIDELL